VSSGEYFESTIWWTQALISYQVINLVTSATDIVLLNPLTVWKNTFLREYVQWLSCVSVITVEIELSWYSHVIAQVLFELVSGVWRKTYREIQHWLAFLYYDRLETNFHAEHNIRKQSPCTLISLNYPL
jgi:hypothetical protein